MLKTLIEKFIDKKEKYAEIYLQTFNRETREEDVNHHTALRWIETHIPGTVCSIARETVTNAKEVTYSAPVIRVLMRYQARRELKKAIETLKRQYNREKLIVVFN